MSEDVFADFRGFRFPDVWRFGRLFLLKSEKAELALPFPRPRSDLCFPFWLSDFAVSFRLPFLLVLFLFSTRHHPPISPSRAFDADSSEFEFELLPSESEDVPALLEFPEPEDPDELGFDEPEFDETDPDELDAAETDPDPDPDEPFESPPEYPVATLEPGTLMEPAIRGEGTDRFEIMLRRLDAASLAARDLPADFFPAPRLRLLVAILPPAVDFCALILDPFFAPTVAEGPLDLRFTPKLFNVCTLLLDRLLEARVKFDVSTLPMHFKSRPPELDEETANTYTRKTCRLLRICLLERHP